jgi:hypothetical protein
MKLQVVNKSTDELFRLHGFDVTFDNKGLLPVPTLKTDFSCQSLVNFVLEAG